MPTVTTSRLRRSASLAGWLGVVLHLAVFVVSGWHSHGLCGPGHGPCADESRLGGLSRHAHDGHAGCPGHGPHDLPAEHEEHKPSRDGHDPDPCGLCRAILALSHAAAPPSLILFLPPAGTGYERLVRPQVPALACLRRAPTCGPPIVDA